MQSGLVLRDCCTQTTSDGLSTSIRASGNELTSHFTVTPGGEADRGEKRTGGPAVQLPMTRFASVRDIRRELKAPVLAKATGAVAS